MWLLAHRRGGLDSHACRRACRFGFSGYGMIAWWIQTTKQPGSCRSCGAGRDADASRIIIDCLITLAQFVRSSKWHYLTLLQSRVESALLRCCLAHWRCFIFTVRITVVTRLRCVTIITLRLRIMTTSKLLIWLRFLSISLIFNLSL